MTIFSKIAFTAFMSIFLLGQGSVAMKVDSWERYEKEYKEADPCGYIYGRDFAAFKALMGHVYPTARIEVNTKKCLHARPLLSTAIHEKQDKMARWLFEHRKDMNLNIGDAVADTALHHLAYRCDSGIFANLFAKELVEAGADPTMTNHLGLTPRDLAKKSRFSSCRWMQRILQQYEQKNLRS